KIHLRMARIVPQRHKHLAVPQPVHPHVIPNNGDPTAVAVLVAKPFEDPFRGMPLLPRPTLILQQDLVDDPDKGVELRTCWRPAPPVTGRHRKRQHLGYCPRINPKLTRRCPAAQPLNLNRITNPPIEFHDLHPSTPADFGQRPSADGVLLRRNRTIRPPQSVRDFLSGASKGGRTAAAILTAGRKDCSRGNSPFPTR